MKLTFYDHCKDKNLAVKKLNPVILPFHEIVILLDGELEYGVNGAPVHLKEKDAMYIPQGATRTRKHSKIGANYISVHFLVDQPLTLPNKIERVATGSIPSLIANADQIVDDFYPNAFPIVEKIIEAIITYFQTKLSNRRESPLVKKIKQYMFAHMQEQVKLEEIAAHVFFSPSYCNTVFKRETGAPVMSYFNNLRLQEAKTRLLQQEITLKEAAESVGFFDYNYFSRSFKKTFGITPLQYRKEQLQFI
jgi:YesN/AraC family two-component response regulator